VFNLLICLVVSVLLLPVAAGIALVWQSVLASLFTKGRTVEQTTVLAGWINSTILVYAIALCVYLTLN